MLKTVDLTKYYGIHRGVQGINLNVEQGEIFGFIGPNGAGKSTTIRMLMQLIHPSRGEFFLLGQKIRGDTPELRRQIGYLPSEINLPKDLTGKQVLEFTARAYGKTFQQSPAMEYAELLQYDMNKKVKSYSLGNRKKLGILLSLLHNPKLLILDEPTSGLDPLVQHAFFDLLQRLKQEGMTIFFSTHILNEVEKICDRVAIIREGEIIGISKVDEIAGRDQRIFEVRFSEEGNLITAYGLSAFASEIRYEGGAHIFTTKLNLRETLSRLSDYEIRDISIHKPSLEQLFMGYYQHSKDVK